MKLNNIIEQTVPGLGYEVVDIEFTTAKIIRIFIDKEGGITIADCEKVSNHMSKLLLVEEVDFNRLEVSSPGLERPLKKIADFERFCNQIVKIKTRELIDGQKVFQGQLLGTDGNIIKLQIDSEKILEIEFDNISRARLVFEYKTNTKIKKKH